MCNHILDTFIAVADCGSFTKAARRLYISPTAVMKQINTLEEHLDMKLVERTPSGGVCHLSEFQIYNRLFAENHYKCKSGPSCQG